MNTYDGHDRNDDFRPGDAGPGKDMITMNPPRWQRWWPGRPITVAGVAVIALASGAGIGYAATNSATKPAGATTVSAAASPTPSPSARPVPKFGPGSRWGRDGRPFGGFAMGPGGFGLGPFGAGGAIHGQFTVPKSGGGYQTIDVQRGTVTAVSGTSVTVKSADGYTATYTVTNKTLVDAQAAGIGSVKKGDSVSVTATVSGGTATAANVLDLTAVKAGRASFGFKTGPGGPPAEQPMPAKQPSA